MSYEIDTSIGTIVIYNRLVDSIPERDLLGDDWFGTGVWHFGWKDGDQCRRGYPTAEAARDAASRYEWSVTYGYGWTG